MSSDAIALWRQVTRDLPLPLALYARDGRLLATNPRADVVLNGGSAAEDAALPEPREAIEGTTFDGAPWTVDGTSAVQVVVEHPVVPLAQEDPTSEADHLRRIALENTGSGMIVQDADGTVISVNDSACQLLGLTRAQFADRAEPKPKWRTVAADGRDLPVHEHPSIVACRTGEPQRDVTVGFYRPDGRLVWMSVTAVPVQEDGEVTGVVVTFHDVTQWRELLSTLAVREQQLRRTFEDSPIGLLIASADPRSPGLLTDVNDAFCAMAGRDAAELLSGMRFVDVLHPDERESANAILDSLLRGERPDQAALAERRLQRPDGSIVWIQVITSLVHAADGSPLHVLRHIEDVTERRAAREHIERLAHSDVLTGLPNRALVDDLLHQARERSAADNQHMALLFVDVDHFKYVNDSLGHEVGDALLVELAGRLRAQLSPSDTVGRVGGDEFLVICQDLGQDADDAHAGAIRVADRVRDALSDPITVSGHELRVSASVGISMSQSGQRSPAELMRTADMAMYHAKARGRNRTETFEVALEQAAAHRVRVERELRRALDGDELELHLQPVVDLATGAWVGAEALVRWRHPDHGLLLPGSFLPVAEHSGLILPLGDWVIEQACRHLAALRDDGWDEAAVSLNVSGRQLAGHDIAAVVGDALARDDLEPDRVRLEITEEVLIELAGSPLHQLHQLSELGTPVGLDDFGTGYSSLTHLRRLPVSFLKIDGSFVSSLGEDAADHAIVSAVIGLAEDLGLGVVAEGVEDERAAKMLLELGCKDAQGWWYGPAMSVDEFQSRRRWDGPSETTAARARRAAALS